jgi:LysR family transcriptional regulator, regulator for bpeEF and oprC
MDRLRRLEVVVRVADFGSFSKAARSLGITPSAVSHAVTKLEHELGLPLFYRTTRELHLTQDGEAICARARSVLEQVAALDAVTTRSPERLRGLLRIGLSASLSRLIVMPAITSFTRLHPDLRLDFRVLTQMREMHTEGVDIMLRVGDVPDSGVVARRIATLRFGAYASPDYLAHFGVPAEPEDLLRHRCVVFRDGRYGLLDEWLFERQGEHRTLRIRQPVIISDDREGLHIAMIGGAGIGRISNFDPAVLASGRLRRILPEWKLLGGFPIYALYRRTPRPTPRIAAFLDFALAAFAAFDPEELTLLHEKGAGRLSSSIRRTG